MKVTRNLPTSSVRPTYYPTSKVYYSENIYTGSQYVKMTLKFSAKCFETGVTLLAGERVLFDKMSRKIFSMSSSTYAYSLV